MPRRSSDSLAGTESDGVTDQSMLQTTPRRSMQEESYGDAAMSRTSDGPRSDQMTESEPVEHLEAILGATLNDPIP